MQYTYEAKDTTGQTIRGTLEAESERMAASRVREMGYYPMRFAQVNGAAQRAAMPVGAASDYLTRAANSQPRMSVGEAMMRSVVYPIVTGVSLKDLALFYRQAAAMINAGVPVQRTLTTIEEQTASGTLRRMLHRFSQHVLAGGMLSEVMSQYPHIFSELQVEFIASGEQTGGLGDMMIRLADYLEQDYALRQMVKKETLYPKFVLVMTFLLPNLFIIIVSGMQAYIQEAVMPLVYLVACALGLWAAFRYAMRSMAFRFVVDTIKSYIPYFGLTVRMLAIGKFCRALAALYSAGVLLPTGMEISARVAGNQYIATLIMRAVAAIKSGLSIADSFRASGVFPPMFISMVGTGEQTGSIDEMLHKVADFYEDEAKLRLHQSIVMGTQLFFLLVGLIVGIIVIRFYTGYFSQIMSM